MRATATDVVRTLWSTAPVEPRPRVLEGLLAVTACGSAPWLTFWLGVALGAAAVILIQAGLRTVGVRL